MYQDPMTETLAMIDADSPEGFVGFGSGDPWNNFDICFTISVGEGERLQRQVGVIVMSIGAEDGRFGSEDGEIL